MVDLGRGEVFLGHNWLQAANPAIDWAAGWLIFRNQIPYSDLNLTQEDKLMEEFEIGCLILQVNQLYSTPTDQVLAYVLGWTLREEEGFSLHAVSTPA
jgi:hypothetical protein